MSHQQLYHDLLTFAPSAVCHCDGWGTIVKANPAAHKLLGWTAQTLSDTAFETLIHPQDQALFTEQFARLRQAEVNATPLHCTLRCVHDGMLNTLPNARPTYVSVDVQLVGVWQATGELEHSLIWLCEHASTPSTPVTATPASITFPTPEADTEPPSQTTSLADDSADFWLDTNPTTFFVIDQDERIISLSEQAHKLISRRAAEPAASLDQLVDQPGLWRQVLGLDDSRVQAALEHALQRQQACYVEVLTSHQDAFTVWQAVHGLPVNGKLMIKLENITTRKYDRHMLVAAKHRAETLFAQRNAILESISDYFLIVDSHMCLSYVNQAFAKHLGTHTTNLLGQSLWNVLELAATNPLRRAFVETVALNESKYAEAELVTADLAGRTVGFQTYPFQAGFIAYGQDISQRKHTEQTLIQALHDQEIILDSIADGVSVLSPDWIYVYANQVIRNSVPDIVGKRYFDLFPEHKGSLFERYYQQVFATGQPARFEAISHMRNFWVEVRVFPTQNGIIIYSINIDERKKLELRLQDTLNQLSTSEEKFRTFFEESILACTMFLFHDNPAQEQLFIYNKKFEKLVSQTAFSDYQDNLTSFDNIVTCLADISHPEDHHYDIDQFERMVQGEQVSYYIEKRFLTRAGQALWVEINCILLRDDNNEPSIALAIIQDINERKRTKQALEQALADKDILLKEVHHRAKNNMQLIASMLAIQSHKLADDLAKQALLDSRNRINLLADIHRLMYQDNNNDLEDNVIDVGQQLRKLTSNLSKGLADHAIHLESNIASFNLAGHQAVPLALIANELLTNAFKHAFTEPRDGDTITISLVREEDNVVLEVRDNGRGLPTGTLSSEQESLGAIMLTSLSDQLAAQLDIRNHLEGGCVARVAFRIDVFGRFSA
ncbi:MAG: PAS domain-containing protein [Deinococcota bacterium]